tara:strand:+ start:14 stop:553 length:540 start_codon:yes stop_codon:yes gene_type:complete
MAQNTTKRIAIIGPESTGKTVLSKCLAEHFVTQFVSEYAASYITKHGKDLTLNDLDIILHEQLSRENIAYQNKERVLFCDSDALTTYIWSHFLFQNVTDYIKDEAEKSARRYTHTILLKPNTAWVDDSHRYTREQEERDAFYETFETELKRLRRPYSIIDHDTWDKRFEQACNIIHNIV